MRNFFYNTLRKIKSNVLKLLLLLVHISAVGQLCFSRIRCEGNIEAVYWQALITTLCARYTLWDSITVLERYRQLLRTLDWLLTVTVTWGRLFNCTISVSPSGKGSDIYLTGFLVELSERSHVMQPFEKSLEIFFSLVCHQT